MPRACSAPARCASFTWTSSAETQPLRDHAGLDRRRLRPPALRARSSTISISKWSRLARRRRSWATSSPRRSTTGGAADSLNNVEMVLVNVRRWRLDHSRRGNGGQRRQSGAGLCRRGNRRPRLRRRSPPGCRTRWWCGFEFADVALRAIAAPICRTTMAEVAKYIDAVSYGQASVVPAYRGDPRARPAKDYYYDPGRNLLIEMTQEVVAKLVAAEPAESRHGRTPDNRHQRRQLHRRWRDHGTLALRSARRVHPADLRSPCSRDAAIRRRASRTACCTSSVWSISTPTRG